jgi:type II secretory pathway component PulJ
MIKTVGRKRSKGFTLAELLMAGFVISVALLGVYSLFQQTMDVQAKMTLGMYHRSRAEEVVDYFADVLERCINLKDIDTIQSGGGDSEGFLELTALSKGFSVRQCVNRQRITWQPTPEQKGYTVRSQAMMYAGKANITFPDASQAQWERLPATELFSQIDALEIEFRETDKPAGSWRREYKGPVGGIAIRVQAASGDQMAQRIVIPAVRAVLE